jgi:hypothetical protein
MAPLKIQQRHSREGGNPAVLINMLCGLAIRMAGAFVRLDTGLRRCDGVASFACGLQLYKAQSL